MHQCIHCSPFIHRRVLRLLMESSAYQSPLYSLNYRAMYQYGNIKFDSRLEEVFSIVIKVRLHSSQTASKSVISDMINYCCYDNHLYLRDAMLMLYAVRPSRLERTFSDRHGVKTDID